MAISPAGQRQLLLHDALRKAALLLKRPIDHVEVNTDRILFRADVKALLWRWTKTVTITYQYVANPSPNPGASPHLLLDGKESPHFAGLHEAADTALAPWRERERLLRASVAKATAKLQAPIDRVDVTPDLVRLRAGRDELAIAYRFVKNPNGRPTPRKLLLDGEDYWEGFAA